MTVVIAYIPGPEGESALTHGIAAAKERSATAVVVNATKGEAYVDNRLAAGSAETELEKRLAQTGVEFEVRQPMGSNIADMVLEVADEVSAELVVIGLRRRTPVGKLIMGSTAQRILLDAKQPILAVKAG